MNKTAIKNFAIWSRKKLMDDVRMRAELIGITEDGVQDPLPQSAKGIQYFDVGTADPYLISGSEIFMRDRIVRRLQNRPHGQDYKTAYRNLVEHTASTWFNRLAAIRFMEVNDYFDDGLRSLSSREEGKQDSDLMSNPFDSNLEFSEKDRQQIIDWRLNNNSEQLFRTLLLKKCKKLSEILPGLFNNDDDPTEMLMNFSITDRNGFVWHLTHDVAEEDWKEQVQIIGWLYQFYNTEFKDETNTLLKKNKQALTKERIPSITQLFTPEWIVRYMVENSLGRIWVEGHPSNRLKANWKHFVEEAKQESEVEEQLKDIRIKYHGLSPEELSFIDPCMGSGHVLAYAFDVLMQIYEDSGYTARDAVRSILENNLYGLDIDDRAYQLAYFSIMMKARQYDRGVFRRGYAPRVYAIEESNGITENQIKFFGSEMDDSERNMAITLMSELLDTFKDAKELGSIIKPVKMDWDLLRRFLRSFDSFGSIEAMTIDFLELQSRLNSIVNTAELLSKKYWITCTNPPYMEISIGSQHLIEYVNTNYIGGKTDMFAVFIERVMQLNKVSGYVGMITQPSIASLVSFRKTRELMFNTKTFSSVLHMGRGIFGIDFGSFSFVFRNSYTKNYLAKYFKLYDRTFQYINPDDIERIFLRAKKDDDYRIDFDSYDTSIDLNTIENPRGYKIAYVAKQDYFMQVPGSPFAYMMSDAMINAYSDGILGDKFTTREGMATAGNDTFLRMWFEVKINRIGFSLQNSKEAINSKLKWFPYNKGGDYRKWYGNNDYVVDWENDGYRIRNNRDQKTGRIRSHNYNGEFAFKSGLTWSSISAGDISIRWCESGFLFDSKGAKGFADSRESMISILGLLNSSVAMKYLKVISPTMDFKVGDVIQIPIKNEFLDNNNIREIVEDNIKLSKRDWDSFETSWDYKRHPLIDVIHCNRCVCDDIRNIDMAECYMLWKQECEERFQQLKANEEELNRIFIDVYGLQKELTPEVADEKISVRRAGLKRDIKSFISYAVGCMMGRYSLDNEGLVFAGGEWDDSKYSTFIPDDDNCIPITDEEYFPDDIVGRFVEFVRVIYGDKSLERNLRFIADAIGGNGEPRDVIRKYFLNNFFKDHCQTYSVTGSGKRPIYWLFDSGKQNGFKALVYMHRWNSDTIATVRARYVTRVQEKYENELRAIDLQLDHLSDPRQKAALQKRREHIEKQVTEIKEYDEIISHIALDHIDINLDDGVKVNHEKVQHDRSGKKYNILAPIK